MIQSTTAAGALMLLSSVCNGFVPHVSLPSFVGTSQSSSSSSSSSTELYISSFSPTKSKWGETIMKNPEERIQDYLKEPEAVEARTTIDGTCLVSGLVNVKDRTDQFLFDLLNHEDSAFEFSKIVAFVDDAKFSKKRLLSRSARYTGLLDKLDFIQASSPGALPSAEQLDGVKSWVAVIGVAELNMSNDEKIKQVQQIITTIQQVPSLVNIAILIQNACEMDAKSSADIVKGLEQSGKAYTIVSVGTIEERPEGTTWYQYRNFGTDDAVLPVDTVFSRDESFRMITELLQLESGKNRTVSFAEVYNVNVTEAKLVKGLREAGYARPQEIDHMIREGPEAYFAAIEKFRTEYPDAAKGYTTNAWWEAEEYQKSRRSSAERTAAQEQLVKDSRTMEIEEIAKEWGKRDYFRQSMAGTIDSTLSEDDYVQSVWERAMFEGDQKYRLMKGETVDEESELATFKSQQERKQEVMLQRAKDEMKELLQGTSDPIPDSTTKKDSDEDKKE